MGYFSSEKPPEKWNGAYFKRFVERLRTALNYLDSENFPDGVDGVWLRDRSVSLSSKITGYGGLVISHDFFTSHTPINVNSVPLMSIGSAVLWSPQWLKFAKVYLEVTGYVANASYPGTVEVHGTSGAIISKQISDTTLKRFEWEIPTASVPTDAMTFVFKCNTPNATYPLTILSARIILKLTESI